MIETKKDEQGLIYALIEWNLVNEKGHFDRHGKYVWVNELEIHSKYRKNGIIREFIKRIGQKVPTARYCYFTRKKYGGRLSIYRKFNIYTRRKICGNGF